MLRTRVCDLLGIRFPIIGAPLGPTISGPELTAAVSGAGGLGIMSWGARPPDLLRDAIERTRALTAAPFGVNMIAPLTQDAQVAACLAARVPVFSFSFGIREPWIERARAAGARVVQQVGSVGEARRAAAAGVDLIVAQGVEAGGHLAGTVATMVLVPRVVDAVAPTPVAAAGGIADARGVVAALALGADAVVLGTRFLATTEAAAHALYKERVVAASEEDAVEPAPAAAGPTRPTARSAPPSSRSGAGAKRVASSNGRTGRRRRDDPRRPAHPGPRFSSLPPIADATGDIESMALLAGQSAGPCTRSSRPRRSSPTSSPAPGAFVADRLAALTAS